MAVEDFLSDHTFLESFFKNHENFTTFQVCTVKDCVYRCFERTCMCLMLPLVIEVVDCIAVGKDDSVIVPLASEDVNEKTVARTAWYSFIAVVSAHHLTYVSFLYKGLECREICLPQVAH